MLLATAVVLAYLVFVSLSDRRENPPAAGNEPLASGGSDLSAVERAAGPILVPRQAASASASDGGEQHGSNGHAVEQKKETAGEWWNRTVQVRFVDESGNPVAGLPVRFGNADVASSKKSRRSRPGNFNPLWLDRTDCSDAAGSVVIRDVQPLEVLLFFLESRGWLVKGVTNSFSTFQTMPTNGWSLVPGAKEQVVTLQIPRALELCVRYADGQPFSGTLKYSIWAKESPAAKSESGVPRLPVEILDGSSVLIEQLPDVGRIWGHFLSTRPGFASKTVFDIRVEWDSRYVVVIASDNGPQWGLEIDLSDLGATEFADVVVYSETGFAVQGFRQTGPAVVRTVNLAGVTRHVSVLVLGDRAGRSDEIDLSEPPGGWRRVRISLAAPGAVKMRVVDSDGKSVSPALAVSDPRRYGSWRKLIPPQGSQSGDQRNARRLAYADENGLLQYSDLPAGSMTLAVESPGYVRSLVNCNVPAGGVVDLGDVALEKMTPENSGRVDVVLEGFGDVAGYVLQLCPPASSIPIRPAVRFSDQGRASFGNLDRRPYQLLLQKVSSAGSGQLDEPWRCHVDFSTMPGAVNVVIKPDSPKLTAVVR